MRIRARVDHDAIHRAAQRVDSVDHLPFAVVLRELKLRADFACHGAERAFDVVERFSTVDSRLTRAEEIQIRAIDDRDSHSFFSRLSQLLNCATSSALWRGLVFESWPDLPDPSPELSAKN